MADKGKQNADSPEPPPPYSRARQSMDGDLPRSPQSASTMGSTKTKTHQRFVLADPVAMRYLQEDPSTTIIGHPRRLHGYECYVVEQWACSRTHPTFIITTYTGDMSQSVVASVISVPTNEEAWSPRLKVYFQALLDYHARRRETPLGTCMVTNLANFPSSLTCVLVPEGDPKKHRETFFVNENLRRLGCSGRMGLTLAEPAPATRAKFYQLYRASDKISLYRAVIELVKLCQVALTLFDVLGPEYADGLLCDVTEKAISEWWIEIGNDLYNVEVQDGILGPTTVAALLGTLVGARNRLSAYGAQISKDVFEVDVTKRAIAYFQKSQRIPKTRRLDRTTLKKLHSATAKAATNEGWGVARGVKSTMAELGGKGGEMMLETLGGKEKAGIADVETVDIERFVALVRGERAKWLWYGKPWKAAIGDMFERLPGPEGMVFTPDRQGGYTWQGSRKLSTVVSPTTPADFNLPSAGVGPEAMTDDERPQMPKLTKRNTGGYGPPGAGTGKLRNAIGLRTHKPNKAMKEIPDEGAMDPRQEPEAAETVVPHQFQEMRAQSGSSNVVANRDAIRSMLELDDERPARSQKAKKRGTDTSLDREQNEFAERRQNGKNRDSPAGLGEPFSYQREVSPAHTPDVGSEIEGSTYRGIDLDELFPLDDANEHVGKLLRRRHSDVWCLERFKTPRNHERLPRQVSFGAAEESVLTWDTSSWTIDADVPTAGPKGGAGGGGGAAGTANTAPPTADDTAKTFAKQLLAADDAVRVRARLAFLDSIVGRWVDEGIARLKTLEETAEHDMSELDSLYYPRLEAYQGLRLESQEALAGDKARLTEVVKDVEILGAKVEYEINALRSKVDDVEDGVEEYERQIAAAEAVVAELEQRYKGVRRRGVDSWRQWFRSYVAYFKAPPEEASLEGS